MRTICAVLCLAGYSTVAAAQFPPGCADSDVPLQSRHPVEDLATGTLPIPDYLDTLVACHTHTMPGQPPAVATGPASAWLDAERARYVAVLAKRPVDVVVAPIQIQGYGLDRIERAIMAANLAYAIGDAGTYQVADPFLTALALGEGERRLESGTAQVLAKQLGARQVVEGFVGHDGNRAFTLTVRVVDLADPKKRWQRDWRSIPFTAEKTPAYVMQEMLPSILRELPLGLKPASTPGTSVVALPTRVTATPIELVAAARPDSSIPTITLLAALVPSASELARERLFERALIASLRSNARSADPFFESYALFNLQRRPTALARIGTTKGAAFDALRALLNGDLPAAQSATRTVTNPFQQLLLQVAVRDLEYRYLKKDQTVPSAAQVLFTAPAASEWMGLLEMRFRDGDTWFSASPQPIKQTLDASFPAKGFDLASVSEGTRVARAAVAGEIQVDIANTRHARHIAGQLEVAACCRAREIKASRWDLLWLLEGAGEARIDRMLGLMTGKQVAPESAMAAIGRYAALFEGHPQMTARIGQAAILIARRSPDDERGTWADRGRRAALAASFWAQGQNMVGVRAMLVLGIPSPDSKLWLDAYGHDFPHRPSWPSWHVGDNSDSGLARTTAVTNEALAFSTDSLEPLQWMLPGGEPGQRDVALATLGTRFAGHPSRPATPDVPANENPAMDLVRGEKILVEGGPYEAAQAAFLAYAPFRTRQSSDRVELSNQAFEFGSRLFWLGQGELARPFFQIAADLDTGSAASLASEQRLLQLSGDYAGAAEVALDRAVRYVDVFAYRDYFSLLHAMGLREKAWNGFSQIRASLHSPEAWKSNLVGHRMAGLDEAAVRAWLKTPEIRTARFKTENFASYYAVLWNATDRLPPADLGTLVEELEGPPVDRIDTEGALARPHPFDPKGLDLVRPTFKPNGPYVRPPAGTRLKSERAYFADAYAAVARGEHAIAVDRFAAMSNLHPLNGAPLAYFAYAAAHTGDMVRLEKYVDSQESGFDVLLARAFFAAGRSKVDESYGLLRHAFRVKPMGEPRPVIAEFQYAQACEWLYRDTRDERFASELLEWAKNHQVIQPTSAWAYAMQYTYEKNPEARVRALAMTRYLDPASERIRKVSKEELRRAQTWLDANPPFRGAQPKSDGVQTTAFVAPHFSMRKSSPTRWFSGPWLPSSDHLSEMR